MNLGFLCALASLSLFANSAQANQIEYISADKIHALVTVDFDGDGNRDKAMIVNVNGSEPILKVFMNKGDGAFESKLATSQLPMSTDGMVGVGSSLSADYDFKSSLKLRTYNDSIGRFRYDQTLTIAYRDGEFIAAGLTMNAYDTIEASGYSCDLNLLTGKGVRNGKKVTFKASKKAIKDLNGSEKFLNCEI